MKPEDFEKAQQDSELLKRLPEMVELSPSDLQKLWDEYLSKMSQPLSKAKIFNAAFAIALRVSRQ